MKPSQLFEGKNSSLYKTFMKTKKNTIKGVKAWAILFDGQIETIKYGISFSHIYKSYKIAKSYGDSQTDYKVIPVLITPISKVVKNKGK